MIRRWIGAPLLLVGVVLTGLAQPGWALQLRAYAAARHDRFTGYPAAPAWNEAAWFGSSNYAGVGWTPADPHGQRQYALVSPLHLVCATHFQPNLGHIVRFLNRGGVTVERTVAALTPINNELGQASDLTLATLSAPLLAADQVAHFPFLNLATEADYLNTDLVVFGWHARAGRGRLAAFDDALEAGINRTRVLRFDYLKILGHPDDAYLEGGDSGSPTFAVAGGRPALVGIHLGVDQDVLKRYSYDTFIPHFLDELNTGMAPAGYQMTPVYPLTVSLTATQSTTPARWRQANPGSCRYELANPGAAGATNATAVLRFPPAAVPDTLSAPGWIVTSSGGGTWNLRRATLAAGATLRTLDLRR